MTMSAAEEAIKDSNLDITHKKIQYRTVKKDILNKIII